MTSPVVPAERERPRLRDRLAFRLALALCGGAAAILAAAGLWNVALQREHMTEILHGAADRAANVLLGSTRSAMLRNDPDDVNRILGDVAGLPGMRRVRIFDKQGRVQKSTDHGEVGRLVDKHAEQCYGCHREDQPLQRLEGRERMRIFAAEDGQRVLSVIAPIRNDPECSNAVCHAHPASQAVLGVLDVQLSLSGVDQRIAASERQMALGLAATVAAVLVLSGALAWFLVLRPVKGLERATAKVAAGDLGARAPVLSHDEIGRLTEDWNATVAALGRARADLEEWGRTLEARVDKATAELETAHRSVLLSEKMASLGKLAAVVAHELNNPLAGIATYAKLLRKQAEKRAAAPGAPPADADTLRALDLVESEAQRCGNIVRNLLLFSRTPGSRVAEEDVTPLLDRCALLVRHQADLQGVEVRVEIEPGFPRVPCDASQVQQMVLALAMNAIEAMPDGGALTLRAARATDGDAVLIEVADTGSGIAAEDLPHVFEPFFTTKPEGKGVGLGLAVVYGIVQRHAGRIDVDTRPGLGTTFRVRLPLHPAPAGPAAPAAAPASPSPAEGAAR